MRNNKNLNIPVTILHVMDDVQYKIGGKLLSINENADTCTIKFTNGRVEKNIPMSDIYINEGFIDAIKSIGKKIGNAFQLIIKKVKGFVAFCENGIVEKNSFCNPINLAILQTRGEMPEGVYFYANDNNVEVANMNGIKITRPDLEEAIDAASEYDIRTIEEYWTRVMNVAGSTDKTVEESINYVNKTFYNKYRLNEDAVTTIEPQQNAMSGKFYDGPICDAERLVNEVRNSILFQIDYNDIMSINNKIELKHREINDINKDIEDFNKNNGQDKGFEIEDAEQALQDAKDELEVLKNDKLNIYKKVPLAGAVPLIFGAPGIGKTMIVKKIIDDFKNSKDTPINMALQYVDCSSMNQDRVIIPVPNSKEEASKYNLNDLKEVPLTWLPAYIYDDSDDIKNMQSELRFARNLKSASDVDKLKKLKDEFNLDNFLENTTYWNNKKGDIQGGVLFLDELLRATDSLELFMEISTKTVGSLRVAKSWAVVAASNRQMDMTDPRTLLSFEKFEDPAMMNRFQIMHFRPEKADWIKWARKINKSTGLPNVLPKLVNYIEAIPGDAVWYATVDNGGYNREAEIAKEIDKITKYRNDNSEGSTGGGFNQTAMTSGITRDAILGKAHKNFTHGIYKKINPRGHENVTADFYNRLEPFFLNMASKGIKRRRTVKIGSYERKQFKAYELSDFVIKDRFTGEDDIDFKEIAKLFYEKIDKDDFIKIYNSVVNNKRYNYKELYQDVYNPQIIEQCFDDIFFSSLATKWNIEEDSREGNNEIADVRKFYDLKNEFSKKDIEDIFRTGCYTDPDKLFKDNMQVGASEAETPVSKMKVTGAEWKKYSASIQNAFEFLLKNYPGHNAQNDFEVMLRLLSGITQFERIKMKNLTNDIFENVLNMLSIKYVDMKNMQCTVFGTYLKDIYKCEIKNDKIVFSNAAISQIKKDFDNILSLAYNLDNVSSGTKISFLREDTKNDIDYHIKAIVCVMYKNCAFYRNLINFVKYMIKTKEITKKEALIGQFANSDGAGKEEQSFKTFFSKFADVNLKTTLDNGLSYNNITANINQIKNAFKGTVGNTGNKKDKDTYIGCIDPFRLGLIMIKAAHNYDLSIIAK